MEETVGTTAGRFTRMNGPDMSCNDGICVGLGNESRDTGSPLSEGER